MEVILPSFIRSRVIKAMINAHPYEEVAYDVCSLKNIWNEVGSGVIGELKEFMPKIEFLKWLKEKMKTECVRYTEVDKGEVKTVALCGGSGSFLLPKAIQKKADVFITGDFKYHEFFDAESRIMIADIGHFESEQFTIPLIGDILIEKFPNFAVRFTRCNTNPIKYL